jgi:hypothetical protein
MNCNATYYVSSLATRSASRPTTPTFHRKHVVIAQCRVVHERKIYEIGPLGSRTEYQVRQSPYRLLSPLTAMNGMLLYGWSTAVIFAVLRRTLVRTLDIND